MVELLKPDFWKDNETAGKVQQEISEIKEEIESLEEIKKELEEAKILQEDSLLEELNKKMLLLKQNPDQERGKIILKEINELNKKKEDIKNGRLKK